MKCLDELTIDDLAATPVWRYEGGSGAEAVVVPEGRDSLSLTDDEVFLAATEFFLPDSTPHLGFCFPVDDAGIDYLQPVIVTRTGHVRFWFDAAIAREVLSSQWNALGKRADEVFPVRFRCRVPVDGHTVAGVIPNVETSAEIAPAFQAGPTANPSGAEGVLSYRSRQDGSIRSARPARVRRLFAKGAGVFEKRRPPRRRVEMTVEFDQGESRGTGVTGDVSRSGMFVRSAQVPSVGPSLNLTVHLPGGRELSLRGRVVRSTVAFGLSPSRGFGLRLTDKPPEYDSLLSRFLDASG